MNNVPDVDKFIDDISNGRLSSLLPHRSPRLLCLGSRAACVCVFIGWDVILPHLVTLQLPTAVAFPLFEQVGHIQYPLVSVSALPAMCMPAVQVVLELAELNERETARLLLRTAPVVELAVGDSWLARWPIVGAPEAQDRES